MFFVSWPSVFMFAGVSFLSSTLFHRVCSKFKILFWHQHTLDFTFFFLPEKLIAIDQNIHGIPCSALKLQTPTPKFEKLRCYFLFLLHQTHPWSNVTFFKHGVIYHCPVGLDVKRYNNTKDVLQLWLPTIPQVSHNEITSHKANENWQWTPPYHPVLPFQALSNPNLKFMRLPNHS